ncbi:hypothetical protein Tco_1419267 [Tanacetum coccineum]
MQLDGRGSVISHFRKLSADQLASAKGDPRPHVTIIADPCPTRVPLRPLQLKLSQLLCLVQDLARSNLEVNSSADDLLREWCRFNFDKLDHWNSVATTLAKDVVKVWNIIWVQELHDILSELLRLKTMVVVGVEIVDFQEVVDARSGVAVLPRLQHGDSFIKMGAKSIGPTFVSDGDEVCDVLLLDVDFEGACGGDGNFTLGGGEWGSFITVVIT